MLCFPKFFVRDCLTDEALLYLIRHLTFFNIWCNFSYSGKMWHISSTSISSLSKLNSVEVDLLLPFWLLTLHCPGKEWTWSTEINLTKSLKPANLILTSVWLSWLIIMKHGTGTCIWIYKHENYCPLKIS